jgi:hypothetical protein
MPVGYQQYAPRSLGGRHPDVEAFHARGRLKCGRKGREPQGSKERPSCAEWERRSFDRMVSRSRSQVRAPTTHAVPTSFLIGRRVDRDDGLVSSNRTIARTLQMHIASVASVRDYIAVSNGMLPGHSPGMGWDLTI